ncbi:hypothetical protein [Fodinicola feengrottensis]|uniref:hypothetical protein n=1 Tax=Fodinicola feengrottensis TaxID=435914 RepID=UPI002443716C|nr:hypothetical protein [Fodinicola feengrottensis]
MWASSVRVLRHGAQKSGRHLQKSEIDIGDGLGASPGQQVASDRRLRHRCLRSYAHLPLPPPPPERTANDPDDEDDAEGDRSSQAHSTLQHAVGADPSRHLRPGVLSCD